jgi:GPH family glycoside/pentoside/hexuronide:cation symporter
MSMQSTDRLSWGQKIGYGSGDFALNLYWQGISLYLFYFYTDVLGLPNAMAGLIYAIGSLWDAVTDPAMGYVAERTRTRWGRYRPYLLFTPIPLGLSYMLLFWHPGELSIPMLAAMALTGQFAFRLVFTMASTPYSSLMARMTQNSQDRAGMAGARMVFAYLGGFAVVVLAGSLLENAETDAQAFLYLALISGALATLVLWLCFWLCREPEEVGDAPAALSLKQSFSGMAQNTPFLIVFASILLMVLGTTVIGKTVLYYFEYQLGDRDAGSSALMAFAATGLLVIPFWTFLTLKTSKRFVWMAGSACAGLALLAFLVNPAKSVAMVTWNYVAIGFGTGAFAVTFWGMLPDTVEYGEWKTGDRVEAMIFGFITFAQKAAVALSAIILGLLLDFIGYQAGALQSAQTLDGLRYIIVGVPLFGILASVACMVYYPLSPKRHADIVAELAAR